MILYMAMPSALLSRWTWNYISLSTGLLQRKNQNRKLIWLTSRSRTKSHSPNFLPESIDSVSCIWAALVTTSTRDMWNAVSVTVGSGWVEAVYSMTPAREDGRRKITRWNTRQGETVSQRWELQVKLEIVFFIIY
jgi:hypothetical protein